MEGNAIKSAIINFEGGVDVEYYNKVDVIYQTQGSVFIRYPNTEKWIQKTRRSRVFFLTNFEVFGHLMKHPFECLI